MLHIVSDSSTLYNKKEALEKGFHSLPLHVVIDQKSYKDYEDITPDGLIEQIRQKKSVSSSQPSIGEKMNLYEELLANPEDEILDITIADGLSGTYQSALMAKENCPDPDRVHVLNSRTLCGPQRAMVERALEMRDAGRSAQEIIEVLNAMADTDVSTVATPDIRFLERGGRVSKLVGRAGEFLKLIPIVIKNEQGTTLNTLGVGRTFKKIFEMAAKEFEAKGVNENFTIYVSHADNESTANKAKDFFEKRFPSAKVVVEELCPMFIVHGGPGCVSLQAIQTDSVQAA